MDLTSIDIKGSNNIMTIISAIRINGIFLNMIGTFLKKMNKKYEMRGE